MLVIFDISGVFVIIATNTNEMAWRFTADEVLQEVIADNDSNDEDFMDDVDSSFVNIHSDMDSNIHLEDEGSVFDSKSEVEEGSDSEYVPDSSTFSEASGEASALDVIDETEVEIATNQAPTLLPSNGSIPVAAPEMFQRGRGQRGRGRGHGRGKG